MPEKSKTEAADFFSVPVDVFFYLARNYLDYKSSAVLFEILILANYKKQSELNAKEFTQSYHAKGRYSLYQQLLLKDQLIATQQSSIYFSPRHGWYCWGNNPAHQLQENTLLSFPKPLTKILKTKIPNILHIATNTLRTIFVTENGLYISGQGFTTGDTSQLKCALIPEFMGKKIAKVAMGENHILVLTKEGVVYSWGNNSEGQSGHGNSVRYTENPKVIEAFNQIKIKDIFAGYNCSFCLTEDGKVWAFGENTKGQLGLGGFNNVYVPGLITFNAPITEVSCGLAHTLFLTLPGQVYSCGQGGNGKLGLQITATNAPVHIARIETRVKKIAAGTEHSLCLTVEGQLYGFGSNMFNQLTEDSNQKLIRKPTLIHSKLLNIVDISSGGNHSLCLDKDGILYSFGSYDWSVLGRDDTFVVNLPYQKDSFVVPAHRTSTPP